MSGIASGTDLRDSRVVAEERSSSGSCGSIPCRSASSSSPCSSGCCSSSALPRTFLAGDIYVAFMSTTPFFALMAIPLTLVVITGEIDLSFPSIMAIGMTAFDLVLQGHGSVWLGFVACLLAGIVAGALNGVIVVRIGIPSLVATIGTQFFWRGAVMVLTNGQGMGMTPVQGTILYPLLVGRIGGVIPAQFVWTHRRLPCSCGSSSTGTASARTCTSSGTTWRAPGSWA